MTGCELCTLHHLGGSHSLPSKLDHLLEEKGKDSLFLNIIFLDRLEPKQEGNKMTAGRESKSSQ